MPEIGPATEVKIAEVVGAAERYGETSVIALAGVPGTGKSHVALHAAQRIATDPLMVTEIQFHPAVTFEEFVEGMRIEQSGAAVVKPGVFLQINDQALNDPENTYVLLIEEFTRADVAGVLGELLTYLEYRDRPFVTLYSRRPVQIAKNLRVLATYNPADRTALNLDLALLRRLRVVNFPPDTAQLAEMLAGRSLGSEVVEKLQDLFERCRGAFPDDFETTMPFGHGIFAQVESERPDLNDLWHERIAHMLRRPLLEPHAFTAEIEGAYPWRDPEHETV